MTSKQFQKDFIFCFKFEFYFVEAGTKSEKTMAQQEPEEWKDVIQE